MLVKVYFLYLKAKTTLCGLHTSVFISLALSLDTDKYRIAFGIAVVYFENSTAFVLKIAQIFLSYFFFFLMTSNRAQRGLLAARALKRED